MLSTSILYYRCVVQLGVGLKLSLLLLPQLLISSSVTDYGILAKADGMQALNESPFTRWAAFSPRWCVTILLSQNWTLFIKIYAVWRAKYRQTFIEMTHCFKFPSSFNGAAVVTFEFKHLFVSQAIFCFYFLLENNIFSCQSAFTESWQLWAE